MSPVWGAFVESYLGLGANLGDRPGALGAAYQRLHATPGVRVLACSRVFETDAIAPEPQPPYLNAVVRVATVLDPRTLLHTCLTIEREMGRVRKAGHLMQARPLDVDVLLFGARVIAEPGLRVPHPHLLERAFVCIPLADVARPELLHPVTGQSLDRAASDAGVRLFGVMPVGPHGRRCAD